MTRWPVGSNETDAERTRHPRHESRVASRASCRPAKQAAAKPETETRRHQQFRIRLAYVNAGRSGIGRERVAHCTA